MKKSNDSTHYSVRGTERRSTEVLDRTDLARVDAMTSAEVDALAAADDEPVFDWSNARIGIPGPKQQLTVRLDKDVIDWFRAQGSGYQTRMNAVLRSFVEAQRERS